MIALSFALAVFTLTSSSLAANPIALDGTISYYMTSANTGDSTYLRCGTDLKCSMANTTTYPPTTGNAWSVLELPDKTYRLFSNFNQWNLDVDPSTLHIQANAQNSSSFSGEVWKLLSWADGTYALSNEGHQGVLDVKDGQTPFVNSVTGESLMGQHWSFRTQLVLGTDTTTAPGTTATATTTAVSTVPATTTPSATPQATSAPAGTPSSSVSASASSTQSATSAGSRNRIAGAFPISVASVGFLCVLMSF